MTRRLQLSGANALDESVGSRSQIIDAENEKTGYKDVGAMGSERKTRNDNEH